MPMPETQSYRKPPPRKLAPHWVILGVVACVSVVFIGIRIVPGILEDRRQIQQLGEYTAFVAHGHDWLASRIEWREFADKWELKTVLVRTSSGSGRPDLSGVPSAQLLQSLCGAVLFAMPNHPTGLRDRTDVFRVTVNFWNAGDEDPLQEMLLSSFVPIPVIDGQCKAGLFTGTYFPTYPAPLDGWYLFYVQEKEERQGNEREFTFRRLRDTDAPLGSFPFEFACRAVAEDPFARRRIDNAATGQIVPAFEGGRVKITAEIGPRGFITITRSASKRFLVVSDRCSPTADGPEL